jgi:hypothetical protein
VSLPDLAGVFGVGLILVAFAGVQLEKMEPRKAPALLLNFVGAALVLFSLAYNFNLPAVIMESIWCLIALYGLVRLVLPGRKPPSEP